MANHMARMMPAAKVEALTANDSDTVNLPRVAQGLFITSSGTIRFLDASGGDSGVVTLPVGHFPVQISRIFTTSLVATGFVLYDKDPS